MAASVEGRSRLSTEPRSPLTSDVNPRSPTATAVCEVRADYDRATYRVLFAPVGRRGQVLLALEALKKQTQKTTVYCQTPNRVASGTTAETCGSSFCMSGVRGWECARRPSKSRRMRRYATRLPSDESAEP